MEGRLVASQVAREPRTLPPPPLRTTPNFYHLLPAPSCCSSARCRTTWSARAGSRTSTSTSSSTTSGCTPSCPRARCRPCCPTSRTPATTSTTATPPGERMRIEKLAMNFRCCRHLLPCRFLGKFFENKRVGGFSPLSFSLACLLALPVEAEDWGPPNSGCVRVSRVCVCA